MTNILGFQNSQTLSCEQSQEPKQRLIQNATPGSEEEFETLTRKKRLTNRARLIIEDDSSVDKCPSPMKPDVVDMDSQDSSQETGHVTPTPNGVVNTDLCVVNLTGDNNYPSMHCGCYCSALGLTVTPLDIGLPSCWTTQHGLQQVLTFFLG